MKNSKKQLSGPIQAVSTESSVMQTGNLSIVSVKHKNVEYIVKNYDLYLFLLPVIVWLVIFCYLPMYGVQIAFKDFNPADGILGSPWVGFKHFERFFNSAHFWPVLRNTLTISIYSLVAGFPAPLILALMLNQMVSQRYKRFIQTVIYAPNFISVVTIVGMILLFLSPSSGIVNKAIELLGFEPVHFMMKSELFSSIYVFSGIWQSAGFGAVIYLAALSNISPELHEAAIMDGASKLKRVLHIDIPSIMPTAMTLLILSLGGLVGVGFEKDFLLQNTANASASEVISTYVYKIGLKGGEFSFSSAVDLMNNAVNFILLVTVNKVFKTFTEYSLW